MIGLRPAGSSVPSADGLCHGCTPGVRSGKPCIIGTRITVSDLLEDLASGMSQEEILRDFPQLRPEHIQAVLHYAAEREKRLGETILDS